MADSPENIPHPQVAALALRGLSGSTGWAIYCARFDEIVKRELDDKIFDPKTPESERLGLIHARRLLVGSYAPEKIRSSLLVTATKEAESAEKKR